MKRFWGFVKKEFLHILRDYRTVLILFGMPVVQILLFGYVITNEIKDARISILDNSKDNITREITDRLLSSGYFKLNSYIQNYAQIEEEFKTGKVKMVVVYEADFAQKLERDGKADIQLISDASEPNTAGILVSYCSAIVRQYSVGLNPANTSNLQIIADTRMYYNEELKGVYMFVPGIVALILILISAMMTSISITREKEFGTMESLLVSPLKRWQIIFGKVTPYVALSFLNAVVIIVLGLFVFGVPVQGSMILLLAESLLYITLSLSLGILISTVSKNQQVAMFISMFGLLLPTLLLSGFIFPIESMPKILQWLSLIMPPRWFISIIRNIMLKGTGFLYVWKETLILVCMTVIFLVVSIKKLKIRLE